MVIKWIFFPFFFYIKSENTYHIFCLENILVFTIIVYYSWLASAFKPFIYTIRNVKDQYTFNKGCPQCHPLAKSVLITPDPLHYENGTVTRKGHSHMHSVPGVCCIAGRAILQFLLLGFVVWFPLLEIEARHVVSDTFRPNPAFSSDLAYFWCVRM